MKGARILQLVVLVLLALYLVAFNNVNPDPLTLPLLPMVIPLPPVLIVVVALLAGWLVGWVPANVVLWRQRRESSRLRRRLEEVERQQHGPTPARAQAPVIPDRIPVIPDRPAPSDEETEPP